MTDETFRQRVMELARELFPDIAMETNPDTEKVVMAEGNQVSLQNMRARFNLSEQSDEDLKALVQHHFGQVLSSKIPVVDELTLEDVRDKLYPQIMPVEYVTAAPMPLVSFPLSSEIAVGIVADFPESYMYLRQVELERWEVSADDIYELARKNLSGLSNALQVQMAGDGKDVLIAVASGDSYDAARILLPEFQEFLANHLGETFRFGVPNRDFLICWRLDCGSDFHQQMSMQVGSDSSERPYPLSSSIFVRNPEGNIHEQANG
ncbi:MAG: hypothetical protein ACI8T1_002508 [Verrucomicrobiales bacterium]|jgi:uncharacterized protein YtpQ (UPF0354 family)